MKNVLKSVLFIAILIGLIMGITCLLLPKESIYKYGLIKTSTYEILREKENTIDAVVIGDSLIYSGISPMEIWHNYGYTVYDMAKSAQLISDSYKYFQVAIASQKPKIIFFEANVLYRQAKNKPWLSVWQDLYKTYLPILTYHNYWKKYLFNNLNDSLYYSRLNAYKGFKYINKSVPGTKLDYMHEKAKVEVPKENQEYFQKIVELCQENAVKLIVISTPNMKSWNYGKHLGAKELTESYGLKYIDLNIGNPLDIDWKTESRDAGSHLNFKGAIKLSNYIGEYLESTEEFSDKRDQEEYDNWDEAYELYEKLLLQ